MKDPQKLTQHIFEKYNVGFTEDDKDKLVKVVRIFARAIKNNNATNITQTEITDVASILNELRKIRKTREIEFKITDRKEEWDNVQCPKCNAKLGKFEATFRGVQNKQWIHLYH